MSRLQNIKPGDIFAFNDPETPAEILDAKTNGTKYMNYIFVLDAPEDFDVPDMYEKHLINDDCIILRGIDRHGHIITITTGDWLETEFIPSDHKDPDKVFDFIFTDTERS